ncbi:type II secretion system minor pseudopilin GspJ [Porticoccaceae bacterium]|nr:type II secretion system minor pseudopilin GspJ [Porticoccaceae bacterium]
MARAKSISRRGRQTGFTLIEALVSLMLLAVMSVMSYQAVEVILGTNERSRGQLEDESQLHRAWQVISRDIMHLRPRVFADGLGGTERAYLTDPSDFGVRFSRGGGPMVRSNPTGISRIEYRLNSDNQLERLSWPITASSLTSEGTRLILLSNVDEVEIEQLSRDNNFSPDWPPLNQRHHVLSLPKMIRITIIQEDDSETSRLLPGLAFDPNLNTGSIGPSGSGGGSGSAAGADPRGRGDEK